jgi:tetratricopeptide (TPR) repeat protein
MSIISPTGGALVDSSVKLGSLLIDMDQLEEAETILNKVQKVNPTAVAYLHQAELHIHKNDFHAAVKLLMKAQKAMLVKDLVPYNPYYQDRDLNIQNLNAEEIAVKRAKRSRIIERRRVLSMSLERQLSATIFALLGEISSY